MSKQVVIIGGVATGMKTAARLRRLDPTAAITVLERGNSLSYGACGFPYYIGGEVKSFDSFDHTPQGILRDASFFASVKGVDARTGCNVLRIDREQKKVIYKQNEELKELPYDKLVLGTGSTPIVLRLPGADAQGIHSFWFPWDVHAVQAEITARKVTDAVVIGAGFVGMEIAEALCLRGIRTSVVEMQERVLPQMLDQEMADLLQNQYLSKTPLQLHLGEKTEAFEVTEGVVSGVVTDKGTIPAQLVIVAVGVRPNVELAKAAGLEIGPSGCIAVNRFMETSDKDIYAGGDCAENTQLITETKVFAPMGSTANKHGRIIADNICGRLESYPGVLQTGLCRLFNVQAGSVGLNERTAKAAGIKVRSVVCPGFDRLGYMPGAGRIIIKLFADDLTERVIGMQAVGQSVDKRIDTLVAAISLGATLEDLSNLDIGYAPPFNGPIDNISTAANVLRNLMEGQFHGINPKEFHDHIQDEDYLFIDVRTPKEYANNRIAGIKNKVNIPLGQIRQEAKKLSCPKDQKIITSCQIDLRGYEAEVILRQQGFTNVYSLMGGMTGWPYETERD